MARITRGARVSTPLGIPAQRLASQRESHARLSLARTAKALDCGTGQADRPLEPQRETDTDPSAEETSWGPARRLKPPVAIEHAPMYWTRPATALGSAAASG